MASDDGNNIWITVGCSVAVLLAVSLAYRCIEPNRGVDLRIHLAYIIIAVCSVVFIPGDYSGYVFTELTVTLVGCVYPVYRATKVSGKECSSATITDTSIDILTQLLWFQP